MNVDWVRVHSELRLEVERGLPKLSRTAREAMLNEYRNWPRGDLSNYSDRVPSIKHGKHGQIHSVIYVSGDFEVGILAPGKEASNDSGTRSYVGDRELVPNYNDALPIITKNGKRVSDDDLTFTQIFDLFGASANLSPDALTILGAMFYRNAFCLDHVTNESGYRLVIPEYCLSVMKQLVPNFGEYPIEVFIYFMDVLAMNEDAKVHALGHNEFKRYGRVNTLLTCTNVIAVLLGRSSLAKLCGAFTNPPRGMAATTDTDARRAFFEEIGRRGFSS